MVDRMQTRAELYATIGYHDYEALDASHREDGDPARHAHGPHASGKDRHRMNRRRC